MNASAPALLALIAELYETSTTQQARIAELEARLAQHEEGGSDGNGNPDPDGG